MSSDNGLLPLRASLRNNAPQSRLGLMWLWPNSELAPQAGTSSYFSKSTPKMTVRAGNGGTPDLENERMGRCREHLFNPLHHFPPSKTTFKAATSANPEEGCAQQLSKPADAHRLRNAKGVHGVSCSTCPNRKRASAAEDNL